MNYAILTQTEIFLGGERSDAPPPPHAASAAMPPNNATTPIR